MVVLYGIEVLECRELWDILEPWSYLDGSIIRAKSDFNVDWSDVVSWLLGHVVSS